MGLELGKPCRWSKASSGSVSWQVGAEDVTAWPESVWEGLKSGPLEAHLGSGSDGNQSRVWEGQRMKEKMCLQEMPRMINQIFGDD